jgi:hypothetical protein
VLQFLDNPTVHVAVARLRYMQRRLVEADQEIEHALRLRPGLPSALVVQPGLQHAAGDARTAAVTYAEAAARLDPSDGWWMEATLEHLVNLLDSNQLERVASVGEEIVARRLDASMVSG